MAWGQGELIATPAAVARIASGIANNGTMMQSRYVLSVNGKKTNLQNGIPLANDSAYAKLMTKYMIEQSAPKVFRLGIAVAGKTGTPERILKSERINDGWYVFFAPEPKTKKHIVVCVRVESCKGSSFAVQIAGEHVVPVLREMGYMESFDKKQEKPLKPLIDSIKTNRNQLAVNER